MTTDNRTNEPNKYAGFLARQNHQRDQWLYGVKCLCGKGFDLDADHALHQVEEILRAALEAAARAAQGAAPQAETDRALEIAHELAKVHAFTLADGEAIARAALSLAAPVLPSSGVDEDKLAEVIRQQFEVGNIYLDSFECKIAARAVAEWLKGQGNAARE